MIVIDPPAQLRNLDQWVGWKYETRDGDRTKVPYQLNGRRASSTDPTTWTAYDVVTSTDTTADTIFDGVGFVVSEYDSIIGVDLDHCVNPETGDLSPWAANVVTRLDSYTEITPSGEGLRIFVNGSGLPPHGRKRLVDAPPLTSGSGQSPALEIYDRGRYLTFTGQHVDGTPTTINVRGDAVRKIHAEYWPEKPPKPPRTPSATLIADDAELIRLAREAKNGGKFGALWTGDTTLHRGDDSAADAALVSMLAFWTACDPDRMDRLFRQSGLWRPKWDEQRGDRTYGVRTVDFAIEHCSETYDPRTITTGTIDSTSTISTTNHTNDISNSDHINDKAAVNTAVSEVSVNVTEPATAPLLRPVFPTWVIPDPLRSLIEDGARALGAPPDFIGAPALALVGGLLGNRYQIQVKKGWEQFPALWIATVGESGTAKTPALNLARRPLDCLQATAMETYREARQQYDADIVRWRSGNSDEPMPVKPVAEHLYTTDSTKEALVAMLQSSAGLTFVRDELTAFIRSFDQYRGGKGGDRADWLSLHSSSPLKPDRKSQDPAYVQHPVVSVAGGIQPDLLHELRQDVEGNDGFTARMLFAYPACPEAPAWTEDEVDDSTITLVEMLYQTLRGTDISDTPRLITLDDLAKAMWVQWYDANSRALTQTSGVLRSAQVKRALHVARFSLILHVLTHPQHPEDHHVSVDTMAGAIELDDYFAAHFRIVLQQLAGQVDDVANGSGLIGRVFRLLQEARGEWCSSSQISNGLHRNVPAEEYRTALDALVEADLVEYRQEVGDTGRPLDQWRTNERTKERKRDADREPDSCSERTSFVSSFLRSPPGADIDAENPDGEPPSDVGPDGTSPRKVVKI